MPTTSTAGPCRRRCLIGDFEWPSQDECRDMGLLLNYANGRMAIFDTKLFDHRENEEDKKSVILEVVLEFPRSGTSETTTIHLLWR